MRECDVVIVDAGPAGISAALSLKDLGIRSLLVERAGAATSTQGRDRNACLVTTNLNHRLACYAPAVLGLFRLVYGLFFAAYGSINLFGWPVRPARPVEFGAWPGWYAGLIEFVAGLLIATGLFTRAAAFIASGEMAVAYFWMHQPRSLWPIGDPPAGNGGIYALRGVNAEG